MRYAAYIWLLAAIYMATTVHAGEETDYWRLATAVLLSMTGAAALWESKRRSSRTKGPADQSVPRSKPPPTAPSPDGKR